MIVLVETNLLRMVEQADGNPRYVLLETIRAYGRAQLAAAGEAEVLRARHAAYYRALAEEAVPHVLRQEQRVWWARLEADLDNLRSALRWYLEQGAAREGLELCGALLPWWTVRGPAAEGRAWFTAFLALPATREARGERARALGFVGLLAYQQGDMQAGQQALAEACALGRQVGHRAAVAWALLWLRWPHDPRDPQARPGLEESLALWRDLGHTWGITETLIDLGTLVAQQGDLTLARTYLDEALARSQETGERRQRGRVWAQYGRLSFAAEDFVTATRLGKQGRTLFAEIGAITDVAAQEVFLGDVAFQQGNYATAGTHYAACLRHQREGQPIVWLLLLQAVAGVAAVALAQGQAERALRLAASITALCAGAHLARLWTHVPMEQTIAAARAALDDGRAAVAWAQGGEMALEHVIAHALEDPADV